jgi:hypothetical protein
MKDSYLGRDVRTSADLSFPRILSAWIRIVRQNHRIIESDVCDPARARNVGRRSIQVADPACASRTCGAFFPPMRRITIKRARTWHYKKTRPCIELSNGPVS